jgi:hypothetical protein
MEINYNTIVQYLCSEESSTDENIKKFSTVKNIMVSSDDFKYTKFLKDISKKTFYRYGVTRYNYEQINISFITSFLTLIDKNFITMDKKEEISYINNFCQRIKEKILGKFKFGVSKFQKPVLLDRLSELKFDDGVMIQVISQILGINFIIFDYKEEKINCIFDGDYMNPWRVTVFMAKHETDWEPLFCDKKMFSYNDSYLKKILTTEDIHYYNSDYLGKDYTLMDNINILLGEENIEDFSNDEDSDSVKENISLDKSSQKISLSESESMELESDTKDLDDVNDTFINPMEEIKKLKLNKTKLKSLKKAEIFELIEKLNLEITANDTKKKMIESIVPYI